MASAAVPLAASSGSAASVATAGLTALHASSFILSVSWRGSQRIFYSHTVLTQKSRWAPCGSPRTSSSSSNVRFFRASGGGLKVQCSLWPPAQMQWNHATQGQSCEELVPN
ncbi:hypothetical protein ZEAMMB73_Zm00001d037940 [Zea mays]|uniref:Uncharacterized protein n=1 Tax=Zea mays TaxID=4577 RepID=A0A1D6M204_MAIZE|nr:hypothetical protein ZEAMMB73_Zm00001d037940 [Zea mays]